MAEWWLCYASSSSAHQQYPLEWWWCKESFSVLATDSNTSPKLLNHGCENNTTGIMNNSPTNSGFPVRLCSCVKCIFICISTKKALFSFIISYKEMSFLILYLLYLKLLPTGCNRGFWQDKISFLYRCSWTWFFLLNRHIFFYFIHYCHDLLFIYLFYFLPMMTKPPSASFSDFFDSLRSPRKLNMMILCQKGKYSYQL